MKCNSCGNANQEDAKFCSQCGTCLQPICSATETFQGQRGAPCALSPERKYVTVLFSDLTGYTSITERLDPEQVKEITGCIFSGVKQIVSKYEGFIERVMGDGVVAFFGIPQAHEDDPIRAVRTVMEIHELVGKLSPDYEAWLGAPLSMHSGINTGLVVTADIDLQKGTHGVAGDAVNVAARLSSLAGPGEILLGEATARRAGRLFGFHHLGLRQVKGKTDPVSVFRLIGPKAPKAATESDRQVFSEMVGRDRELDRLQLQVMKVINGEGSVVNVVGEAGIGKSRLIAELRKREVMRKVTLLEGRAISIGKNLSFHPIIDLAKQWAGIAEDCSESVGFERLEGAIRAVHPDGVNEILPFLATLMGMKLKGRHGERIKGIEGEALEKLILKSMRDLLVKGSEIRPTVIVMEDLHWADESSLRLLESLYPLAEKNRLLFINVFRPGYWQSENHVVERIGSALPDSYIKITLQPLDKAMSEALIANMLDIRGLPYSLQVDISERAGGNPFFIEEVVRSLIDQGAIVWGESSLEANEKIDSVTIPHTINDVLMARIDRLEERTRELVKIASVIGRSFFDRVLKDVATSIEDIDSKLNYLKELQLVRDRIRMEELEYLFKHALAQEVAYESTLLQQRKEIHRKVARSIEKLFEDRLHEFYGMLAYHCSKAEDPEKAEEWMVKAGEEALRTSASSEALNYYKEALRLYLAKYGEAANPKKLAEFEKNIALAYMNRAEHANAVTHFDKLFSLWGRHRPRNRMIIMARLIYDLSVIALRLYLPSITRKRIPDLHVNEVYDLSLKKDLALIATNPKRWVTETLGDLRESFKYDQSKLKIAPALQTGASSLLALLGLQRMSATLLQQASKLVDPLNVHDVTVYGAIKSYVGMSYGKWDEMPVYDKSLFCAALRNGVFYWAAIYGIFQGLVKAYQGQFNESMHVFKDMMFLQEEYKWNAPAAYWLASESMLVCRRLREAHSKARDMIANAIKVGSIALELGGLGLRAMAQLFLKDATAARNSLAEAEQLRCKQTFWPPYSLAGSLFAQFMLDLQSLEAAIGGESKSLISECSKAALESGKKTVSNSAKWAAHRMGSYRLMGVYFWLLGKQRKAFRWFDKSVREGERLQARPEVARTYMEMGKRLIEPCSKSKKHNGISGAEYLEKAGAMFGGMDLEWDLEELERVKREL